MVDFSFCFSILDGNQSISMELAKNDLFSVVKEIIIQSHLKVYQATSSELLESYGELSWPH